MVWCSKEKGCLQKKRRYTVDIIGSGSSLRYFVTNAAANTQANQDYFSLSRITSSPALIWT